MQQMLFDGLQPLIRTLVVGVLAYVVLVTLLRASGKRTLAKMNAFDFVVTVALGSTLATILLNRDVSLAQGSLALALLIGLQFLVTWTSVRVRWIRSLVTGEPTLMFFRGEFLPGQLKRARVTESEVRAAVRDAGTAEMAEVEAVVLETDGTFSVVGRTTGSASALEGVTGLRS